MGVSTLQEGRSLVTGPALVLIGSTLVQLVLTAFVRAQRRRAARQLRLHLVRVRLDRYRGPDG